MCETREESGTGFVPIVALVAMRNQRRYFRADQHQSVFKESLRLGSIERSRDRIKKCEGAKMSLANYRQSGRGSYF